MAGPGPGTAGLAPAMSGNVLSDFPADQFGIRVFCERCDHQADLDRAKVPDGFILQDLPPLLRCSACGAREATVRIFYTGAGGYRHQG